MNEMRCFNWCFLGDRGFLARLCHGGLTSLLKTLATKHKSTVTKMATKHQATITTPHGPRRCFEARIEREGKPALVARCGGIFNRKRTCHPADTSPRGLPTQRRGRGHREGDPADTLHLPVEVGRRLGPQLDTRRHLILRGQQAGQLFARRAGHPPPSSTVELDSSTVARSAWWLGRVRTGTGGQAA